MGRISFYGHSHFVSELLLHDLLYLFSVISFQKRIISYCCLYTYRRENVCTERIYGVRDLHHIPNNIRVKFHQQPLFYVNVTVKSPLIHPFSSLRLHIHLFLWASWSNKYTALYIANACKNYLYLNLNPILPYSMTFEAYLHILDFLDSMSKFQLRFKM